MSSFLGKILETSLQLSSKRFSLLSYLEDLYALWIQYFLNTMSSSYQNVPLNYRLRTLLWLCLSVPKRTVKC